jgi:hypothetical protein
MPTIIDNAPPKLHPVVRILAFGYFWSKGIRALVIFFYIDKKSSINPK